MHPPTGADIRTDIDRAQPIHCTRFRTATFVVYCFSSGKDFKVVRSKRKREDNCMFYRSLAAIALVLVGAGTFSCVTARNDSPKANYAPGTGPSEQLLLPTPFATPSARNNSKVIGWPKGKMPVAAPGFEVSLFAENLDSPRQAYVLPNKDILVVEATREWPGRADRPEKSANRITLFRDTNGDGKPDVREVFLTGLNMPHGMAAVGRWVFVGDTGRGGRAPYKTGG